MKPQLHPRNRHQVIDGVAYRFDELSKANPDLIPHIITLDKPKASSHQTINFSDASAVKELNRALLLAYYGLQFWQLPEPFLCPPVPGRADYIHHIADLLASDNNGEIPTGRKVKGIDVGTGANLIYPIIGRYEYKWSFLASELNPMSVQCAKTLIQSNNLLKKDVKLIAQSNATHYFDGIIQKDHRLAFTMCNPPFHKSAEEASKGSEQKQRNLAKNQTKRASQMASSIKGQTKKLNFGGQQSELWCDGGEVEFVCNMIKESVNYQEQVLWFSSLVSKKDSLKTIQKCVESVAPESIKIIEMGQGSKISRFIAWTFIPAHHRSTFFE